MTWLAFALAAGLASALNVAVSKFLLRGDDRPVLVGGVVHLLGGVAACAALPFVPLRAELSAATLGGLLLMGVIYTLGNALYFSALRSTELSEIDLWLRSSALWTFVGGVVLLAEPVRGTGLLGALLVLASLAMLSQQPRRLVFSRPQLLALGAAICFGAGNVVDKALSAHFDAVTYSVVNLLLTGVGMLALARPGAGELLRRRLYGGGAWVVGATFALTQVLLILAFQAGGSAGEVILVAQVRLLVLMGVGYGVLNERGAVGRKLGAAGLMLAGIYCFARLA